MPAALTVPGQSIGQSMHMRRVLFGLTLREVAGHLGVSVQYLSDIERNRREPHGRAVDGRQPPRAEQAAPGGDAVGQAMHRPGGRTAEA